MKRLLLLLLVPSLAAAEVKIEDAAKTVVDAAAKLDLKNAKFGETLTIDTIAPLDTSKTIDAGPLRDSIAKLKLKLVDDRMYGNTFVLIVEAANGARARIAFDHGGGAITLTAPVSYTHLTLPTICSV